MLRVNKKTIKLSSAVIKFNKTLTKESFDSWVKTIFECTDSLFDLWGNPIKLGYKKIHVYGLDKHSWQPIFIEFTGKHIIVIVHDENKKANKIIRRLFNNTQQYIDSKANLYFED